MKQRTFCNGEMRDSNCKDKIEDCRSFSGLMRVMRGCYSNKDHVPTCWLAGKSGDKEPLGLCCPEAAVGLTRAERGSAKGGGKLVGYHVSSPFSTMQV